MAESKLCSCALCDRILGTGGRKMGARLLDAFGMWDLRGGVYICETCRLNYLRETLWKHFCCFCGEEKKAGIHFRWIVGRRLEPYVAKWTIFGRKMLPGLLG